MNLHIERRCNTMFKLRDLYGWLVRFYSRPRNVVFTFLFFITCFYAYGTYRRQYYISLADKVFAIERVEKICKNPTLVKATNYGANCRQYEFDSIAIDPHYEGITAVLDSWYIWDKRTGVTWGTIILCIAIIFMGGVICTLHFCGGHRRIVDRFNDYEDQRFIDNYPTLTSARAAFVNTRAYQHNALDLKEA